MTSQIRSTEPTALDVVETVLSADTSLRRPGPLSASLTFGWRALQKVRHVPEQLGDVVGIPIIFTLLFTYLFGGALVGSTGRYLQFLLPGSLVMSVLLVTIYAGVTLNVDVTTGAHDRFRSLPVWRAAPIIGGMLGDLGRYLIAATLVMAVGVVLGFRPDGGVVGVLSAVALVVVFAFGLSWVWTLVGLVARTPSAVMNLGMLALFPLAFASNVFVDPQTMPAWLRAFVDVNPVSTLVTAARELMAGTATTGRVLPVLLMSATLTAVFAPLTMRRYAANR